MPEISGLSVSRFFEQLLEQDVEWNSDLEQDLCFAVNTFTDGLLREAGDGAHVQQQVNWIWDKTMELTRKFDCTGVLTTSYAAHLARSGKRLASLVFLEEQYQQCILRGGKETYLAMLNETKENLKSFVVERWHFRMLNDSPRNESYFRAIAHAIALQQARTQEGASEVIVLDIGGGTGLLSIFAARAGAGHVYCCEMNTHLAEVARECVAANGLEDRITVLSIHSSALTPALLRGRVHVIVSELVDSGLLGEHVLPTLRDAQLRLLKQGGIVIPHAASVFGVPISCLKVQHRFHREKAERGEGESERVQGLMDSCDFKLDETYTCESLNKIAHTALSPTIRLCSLPLDGSVALDSSPLFSSQSHAFCSASGTVHALACWFELQLLPVELLASETGGGTWNTVSSHADRPQCCWDQSLFVSLSAEGRGPLRVLEGQLLQLTTYVLLDQLRFDLQVLCEEQRQQQQQQQEYFLISELDMCVLNDKYRMDMWLVGLQQALSLSSSPLPLTILELYSDIASPCFWLKCLQEIERADRRERPRENVWLDKLGMTLLFPSLRTAQHLVSLQNCLHYAPSPSLKIDQEGKGLLQSVLQDDGLRESCDVILVELIEPCGLLAAGALRSLFLFIEHTLLLPRSQPLTHRDLRLALDVFAGNADPVVLPSRLTVMLACIECPELLEMHTVMPGRTVQVDVGCMQRLCSTLLQSIDLDSLETLRYLSRPVPSIILDLHLQHRSVTNTARLRICSPGHMHAIAFWFRLDLRPTCLRGSEQPGSECCTKDQGHWRQAAFLLREGDESVDSTGLKIEAGDELEALVTVDEATGVFIRLARITRRGEPLLPPPPDTPPPPTTTTTTSITP